MKTSWLFQTTLIETLVNFSDHENVCPNIRYVTYPKIRLNRKKFTNFALNFAGTLHINRAHVSYEILESIFYEILWELKEFEINM